MSENKISRDVISSGIEDIFPRLWRYALSLTGARDTADDLAQNTVLRGLERYTQFQPGTKLDAWLFRIAQRIWIDEMRKQVVRRGQGLVHIEEIDLPDTKSGPESNIFAKQTLLKVMQLPEAQRSALMLVYIEGYSYAECAEILDIPIGTVMSRLAAARKTLKTQLQERV